MSLDGHRTATCFAKLLPLVALESTELDPEDDDEEEDDEDEDDDEEEEDDEDEDDDGDRAKKRKAEHTRRRDAAAAATCGIVANAERFDYHVLPAKLGGYEARRHQRR